MFRHLGWNEAADLIEHSMERTIEQKKVTYDFERLMPGATKVKTSEFADAMIENMDAAVLSKVVRTPRISRINTDQSSYCCFYPLNP